MADVILENVPKGEYGRGFVRAIMTSVLPIPGGSNPGLSFEMIRKWLDVNASKLQWDAGHGRFILGDERSGKA